MGDFLEMLMVLSFGISWPVSIIKTWKSKSVAGKSILFSIFIWIGYVFGVSSKFIKNSINYVVFFYMANLIFVSIDILLYLYKRKKEKNLSAYDH